MQGRRAEAPQLGAELMERAVIFRELAPEIPTTTYGTFGLYKYPAKFIPQVIAYALRTYGSPGTSIFDPFAGYGTVGTLARLFGNDYELWDLNPLLEHLHAITVMPAIKLDTDELLWQMLAHKEPFKPDWSNIGYWYPEDFLPLLSNIWGFYHSLENGPMKQVLLIPLLKATRYFSYNDEKRQKLSRSPMAKKRIMKLRGRNWQYIFLKMVIDGVNHILTKLDEYERLGPRHVEATVRAGIDALTFDPQTEHDILITSPPYLQAQEYIRASKMDLFWLGYPEAVIRELGKKEFPYQDVPRMTKLSRICPRDTKTVFQSNNDARGMRYPENHSALAGTSLHYANVADYEWN